MDDGLLCFGQEARSLWRLPFRAFSRGRFFINFLGLNGLVGLSEKAASQLLRRDSFKLLCHLLLGILGALSTDGVVARDVLQGLVPRFQRELLFLRCQVTASSEMGL